MIRKTYNTACVAIVMAVMLPMLLVQARAEDVGQLQTVSGGSVHNMAIQTDGSLWSWGNNSHSQLGDGYPVQNNDFDRSVPQKVMDGVVSVSVGKLHTLAVRADGALWCWGDPLGGALGYMDPDVYQPTKIMEDVRIISAGEFHSMAVKNDGTLWSWGSNTYGQVGNGTLEFVDSPTLIMRNVASISAGFEHSLAVKQDGTLWGWGLYNERLGDIRAKGEKNEADVRCLTVPVKIMDDVKYAVAGGSFCMAVKNDGTLWTWGENYFGELGNGTTRDQKVPTKVMDDVRMVTAGASHAVAVKTDGSLWAWGRDTFGQVGNEADDPQKIPVQIMDQVAFASAGALNTMAVKNDGTLWEWGIDTGLFAKWQYNAIPYDTSPWSSVPQKRLSNIQRFVREAALHTTANATVDGVERKFDTYQINGNNYFKLRDLAYALNGTRKQFSVSWDQKGKRILLQTGQAYQPVGGELHISSADSKTFVTKTSAVILLDGQPIEPTAYIADGNHYFKLRDLADALDFGIEWIANTNTVEVTTQ